MRTKLSVKIFNLNTFRSIFKRNITLGSTNNNMKNIVIVIFLIFTGLVKRNRNDQIILPPNTDFRPTQVTIL